MPKIRCAPSLMCANLLRLENDLAVLEAGGVDEWHFDIMDGHFVPNIALGFDLIRAVRSASKLPCAAHLMIERPERYIPRFIDAGATAVTVHVETCPHAHRTLTEIRALGASPGIAINPATPLTTLAYLLELVDRVLVMSVDPGYAGQQLIAASFERVRILHENLRYLKAKAFIEVDGNISPENAARFVRFGAAGFVLGTAAVFLPGQPCGPALERFRAEVLADQHLV